jgi:hypothetical protein
VTPRIRGFLQRGNRYFADAWRLVPFQPILFTFLAGAVLLVIFTGTEPLHLEVLSEHLYIAWCSLGIFCCPAACVSYHLITHKTGTWRYRGYWLRLAADMAAFANLTAFLLSRFEVGFLDKDYRTVALIVVLACAFFTFCLIIRDIWKLSLTESVANYLYRAGGEEDFQRRADKTERQLLPPPAEGT